jgi:pimeloyl-ACP methyl ester carboxylesterase
VLVNGAGGPIEGWYKIIAPLEELGTVFSYNRPGVGGSSAPKTPQTGEHSVRCLRSLLHEANLPPPYVLVGHSLGGLIVNLFARRFPAEVAAAVMLDATAPEDVSVLAVLENRLQRFIRRAADKIFGKNPSDETEHLPETLAQIEQAGAFPPIPLIAVTGVKPAMAWATPAGALAARAAHQRRLVALSPRGKQVIAQRSGHFPQFTEPHLVVEAIREALLAV